MLTRLLRPLLFLLASALSLSLALNVYLWREMRNGYRHFNYVRLNPIGLHDYPPAEEEPTMRPLVLFFGDSRAFQWHTPSDTDPYHFINRGVGGQTSVQAWTRLEHHLTPLQPNIVVLQVGVNDLTALPYLSRDREAIITGCQWHIEQIVNRARELGATVVLTTIFPLGDVGWQERLMGANTISAAIDEVNEFIISLEGEGVIIFDAADLLADEEGRVRSAYQEDWLHINAAGYEALNEALVPLLLSLSEVAAPP